MTTIKSLSLWLFWSAVYLFRPAPKSIDSWLKKAVRTRNPIKTFSPFLYHNNDGQNWSIYFDDESSYVERRTIAVDVYVGQETGNIVGLNICDSQLRAKETVS